MASPDNTPWQVDQWKQMLAHWQFLLSHTDELLSVQLSILEKFAVKHTPLVSADDPEAGVVFIPPAHPFSHSEYNNVRVGTKDEDKEYTDTFVKIALLAGLLKQQRDQRQQAPVAQGGWTKEEFGIPFMRPPVPH